MILLFEVEVNTRGVARKQMRALEGAARSVEI